MPRHAPDTTTGSAVGCDWRHNAACASRDHDPDLWHPDGTTGPHLLQAEKAKRICREECPVMDWCQTWALSTRQDHGIYGGLDEAERRAQLRNLGRRRTATKAVA